MLNRQTRINENQCDQAGSSRVEKNYDDLKYFVVPYYIWVLRILFLISGVFITWNYSSGFSSPVVQFIIIIIFPVFTSEKCWLSVRLHIKRKKHQWDSNYAEDNQFQIKFGVQEASISGHRKLETYSSSYVYRIWFSL